MDASNVRNDQQRSDAPAIPSRRRAHTLGVKTANDDQDRAAQDRKRSSWISQTLPSVPSIPQRFLHGGASPYSSSNSREREQHHAKGDPVSSPLAFDFTFASSRPFRASTSNYSLRATPDRRSLPPPRHSHAVARPAANFESASSASSDTRGADLDLPTTTTFATKSAHSRPQSKDQATLAALTGQDVDMDRTQPEGGEDLFMQLAEDSNDGEPTLTQRAADRALSRSSWHDKRQHQASSAHTPAENGRPRATSRLAPRPSSRFSAHIDTSRANSGYKALSPGQTSHFTSPRYDGPTPGSAQLRRGTQFSNAPDCSPRSAFRYQDRVQSPEKSPELPTFGRRRPSFGYLSTTSNSDHRGSKPAKRQDSEGDSPANSSEAKRSAPESDSVDSQTAPSTVWDELDDLKSRIKKLELTGKIPPTSSAALLGGVASSERPRTATTAPTTIDSSPKQQRKSEPDVRPGAQRMKSSESGPLTLADIHPTLHTALAKAKTLLSAALYRTLEATAMDALQLVAMTGSAGPQGTTFSAASIINGVTVSDRHIRRKADLMCRNLTDLCLALCEGKHEAPSIVSSPVAMETPPRMSGPKSKYSRSSLSFAEDVSTGGTRSFSRLEARRSSILGLQPSSGAINSPQASGDDFSEHENTPSLPHRAADNRHQSRLDNRLSAPRYDQDEDIRPPSRAMTEIGNYRSPQSQQHSPRDYNTLANKQSHRSPSLRESLNARRPNATAFESNRDITRVASLNLDASRRRFTRDSTPPVLEEEANEQDEQLQKRRRITSFGHQYSSRRAVELGASRTPSLSHRRPNMMVE